MYRLFVDPEQMWLEKAINPEQLEYLTGPNMVFGLHYKALLSELSTVKSLSSPQVCMVYMCLHV